MYKYAIIVSHNSIWVAGIFKHCILFDLFVYIQGETLIKYDLSIYLHYLYMYKVGHLTVLNKKKTFPNIFENTFENRHLIAIISMTLQNFGFKI